MSWDRTTVPRRRAAPPPLAPARPPRKGHGRLFPADGAVTVCSIFMASSTHERSALGDFIACLREHWPARCPAWSPAVRREGRRDRRPVDRGRSTGTAGARPSRNRWISWPQDDGRGDSPPAADRTASSRSSSASRNFQRRSPRAPERPTAAIVPRRSAEPATPRGAQRRVAHAEHGPAPPSPTWREWLRRRGANRCSRSRSMSAVSSSAVDERRRAS